MNVSLTPEMEVWVKKQVASGKYRTASQVVRDALQSFMVEPMEHTPQWTLESLKSAIQEGLESEVIGEWDMEKTLAEVERWREAKGKKAEKGHFSRQR